MNWVIIWLLGILISILLIAIFYFEYFRGANVKGTGQKKVTSDRGLPLFLNSKQLFRISGDYNSVREGKVRARAYDYETDTPMGFIDINFDICKIIDPMGRMVIVDQSMFDGEIGSLSETIKRLTRKNRELIRELRGLEQKHKQEMRDFKEALKVEITNDLQKNQGGKKY